MVRYSVAAALTMGALLAVCSARGADSPSVAYAAPTLRPARHHVAPPALLQPVEAAPRGMAVTLVANSAESSHLTRHERNATLRATIAPARSETDPLPQATSFMTLQSPQFADSSLATARLYAVSIRGPR